MVLVALRVATSAASAGASQAASPRWSVAFRAGPLKSSNHKRVTRLLATRQSFAAPVMQRSSEFLFQQEGRTWFIYSVATDIAGAKLSANLCASLWAHKIDRCALVGLSQEAVAWWATASLPPNAAFIDMSAHTTWCAALDRIHDYRMQDTPASKSYDPVVAKRVQAIALARTFLFVDMLFAPVNVWMLDGDVVFPRDPAPVFLDPNVDMTIPVNVGRFNVAGPALVYGPSRTAHERKGQYSYPVLKPLAYCANGTGNLNAAVVLVVVAVCGLLALNVCCGAGAGMLDAPDGGRPYWLQLATSTTARAALGTAVLVCVWLLIPAACDNSPRHATLNNGIVAVVSTPSTRAFWAMAFNRIFNHELGDPQHPVNKLFHELGLVIDLDTRRRSVAYDSAEYVGKLPVPHHTPIKIRGVVGADARTRTGLSRHVIVHAVGVSGMSMDQSPKIGFFKSIGQWLISN